MATIRQKRLAKNIVENLQRDKPLNKQELVASVGYSLPSAEHKATEIIDSKGTQEELSILGFDVDTAKGVVSEILTNDSVEPKDRLKAASEVFKVHGAYAPEKSVTIHMNISKEERNKILGISQEVITKMAHEEVNG